ncbi:MAG: large extracellular alpha-helical [Planctomycetota bacterium]|nr:MAG: large extracellular alpha-helical [Planctomycetota bacterium]
MRQRRFALFAALLALICLVNADPPPSDARTAGETALKDRDYAKAETLLTQALGEAKSGQDEILILIATAQQNAKKNDEAIASLDRLVREYPASGLKMKALYKKGDLLAAKKEFALAGQIYDAQVAAVTAPERRKKIAMIYVEAGREFLNPKEAKDPTFVANYVAARNLLVKALELEALGVDEEGVRVDVMTCELKGGMDRNQLRKTCKEFFEKFPKAAKLDEALFAQGTALRDTGLPFDAKVAWLRIPAEFATSVRAAEALWSAALLHVNEAGQTGSLEELRRALPLLRRCSKDFAASEWGPKAGYLAGIALAQYEELRDEARKELAAFADGRAKDERAPEALLRVAWLWRADMDDAKAIATLEDFLKRFPDSPRWPEVRQAIADVRFEAAGRAFVRKDWAAARAAAEEFAVLHPTDGRAAAMSFRVGQTYAEEKKWKEAVEAWMRVATKFPAYNEGGQARFEAAKAYANELDDFETAMKELPKVGGSSHGPAQQFLQLLQNKSLALSSEKVFTGAETPAVKLTVRNVETVKFRFWTLDLKDYFEKRAATTGLESLEVAVIAPDKEWEVPVKDYRRFKEMKLDVELPKKDPGAYVVSASIGTQEAKTVVIVSDLATIARAGRSGATVVVQNLRTGERVENATVRMAADGKHVKTWKDDMRPSSLSILAESNGHLAFRDMALGALPIAPKREPRVLILTDRSLYGDGDEVKVRLVVRDTDGGAYLLPKDKNYILRAASGQGIVFHEATVALSKFGTAAMAFTMPKGLHSGVTVSVIEKALPQEKLLGAAQVAIAGAAWRFPHFEYIADDTPKFVGDNIDVTAILRDEWNRPMGGRWVRILAPGDLDWRDTMTGTDGTFAIQLRDTDRFYRDGVAAVQLNAENTADILRIPVLPRTPAITFDDESRVTEPVVAGEPKTIAFTAKKADDTAFTASFRWTVIRANEAGQRFPVAQGDVTSDKDGKAKFSWSANEAGVHTITVSTKDADGMPTRLQTAVAVMDDKEERKLRLLSGADTFEPGKPVELTVLSRLDKGLAFVTIEGEKVEQVLAVTLEKGKNAVKLNTPPPTTRDFSVTVMMMQGGKFHADVRDFALKAPEVKIEPEKKEVKPGEEIVVKVTAKPGSEVWLLSSAEITTGIDTGAFNPMRPGAYFAADSSVATAFSWQTQQVDPQLLAALAQLEQLDRGQSRRVMLEKNLDKFKDFAKEADHNEEEFAGGSGAGGRYGGRLGGKRNLVARGGGSQGSGRAPSAQPVPYMWTSAEAGADGIATFRFRAPGRREDIDLQAWSIDGGNAIATAEATVKVRASVFAEVRFPESAVEGEKTSAVVLLTNWSGAEGEASIVLNGAETKVKVPARSTAEKDIDWTAAPVASVSVDGAKQDVTVAMRAKGPSAANEKGGAFTARAELKVDGQGKTRIFVATSPAALLEALAEGGDDLTRASDVATRLIARLARHRVEKTDATKLAVMEFAALRAQGLADAAANDAAWPVLLYLAAAEAKAAEFDIEPDPALLKQRFAQATSDETKALILFALSRGKHAEYGFLFRLWRGVDTLSPRALACVALAMKAAGKTDEAKSALEKLAKSAKEDHWEAAASAQADSANTGYAATAVAALAMSEIDPAHALLPKARAWLLARRPRTAFERAALALAMQTTPDKGGVTEVKVDGQAVKRFGEVAATEGVIEPTGSGTFYAMASRETGVVPEPAVKVAVKRTAEWPRSIVEGKTAMPAAAAVKEPVENPSMGKVAAGHWFRVKYELTVTGPTTQYSVVELPRNTGLQFGKADLRVLLPPQAEAEKKIEVAFLAYADAPAAYPEVEVLAPGAAFREGWTWTHGERTTAGAILFEKKKWKECRDILLPLFEKGTLVDAVAAASARMLGYSAVELAENDTVVKYFEVLKEKAPGEVVPFDKIRAIAKAYAAVNEHERSMQVSGGACDAYFLQEANLAGALEDLGRMKESVAWMKTLLSDYPDSPLNREMLFGFGQRLYSKAKSHKASAEKNDKALSREELLAESAGAFEHVLSWFPAHEENDRAMLSLCSAYLEAGKFDLADGAARLAAARFVKSRFLDTFDYTQAFALFAQKKFPEALTLCDKLETFDYGAKANPGPGVIRTQAVLMKAQIFHAKGEMDKAVENYKKVKEKSADAARSIAFLEREAISVKDVTVAPLAKAAELELEYAGVAEAHVRAYKVDLTMLALRRKNLVDASTVEVAGIKPVFEKAFKLDHPNARRREKQTFTLDLKDPGAYLVGVKAGDFFASGIILRSNLSMAVQEEADGNVRVNISDMASGGFAESVKVTIFGTDDQKIASDKTDLRGIWETSGVRGLAIVVAEKDGHVAMHRGASVIGMIEDAKRKADVPAAAKKLSEQQQELLEKETRSANDEMEDNYNRNLRNKQQGVEVERMKK